MVAATSDANELRMLAWAVHLMQMHSCNHDVTASYPAAHRPAGPCGRVTARVRVAESPSRRVAHCSRVAESRVAAPRLGATRPTLTTAY